MKLKGGIYGARFYSVERGGLKNFVKVSLRVVKGG